MNLRVLLAITLVLALPAPVTAAISVGSSTSGTVNADTLTIANHTSTGNLLAVGVGSNCAITSATFNGVAMTSRASTSQSSAYFSNIFTLASPGLVTADVVLTGAGCGTILGVATNIHQANIVTPVYSTGTRASGIAGSFTTSSITLVTPTTSTVLYDFLVGDTNITTLTPGTSTAQSSTSALLTGTSNKGRGSWATSTTSSSKPMSWTIGGFSDRYAQAGVTILEGTASTRSRLLGVGLAR